MKSVMRFFMILFACWCFALPAAAQTDSVPSEEPAFITVKQDVDGVHELCCHVPQSYMHSLKGAKFLFTVVTTVEGKEIHHKQDGMVFADLDCQNKVRLRLQPGQSCKARVEFSRSGQLVRQYEMTVVVE